MRPPWAVVCDFDGTATVEDLGDQVSIRFAGLDHWTRAEDEYRDGRYAFGELLRRIFAPITATREEIAAFARDRAVLRPGFVPFVEACRDARVPFVVCSAGLDVYIEPVLERLPPAVREHVAVRCNLARPTGAGLEVTFHGDGAHAGCGSCGFCKGTIVDGLRAAGHRVAFIGDGSGDRCGARAADLVFARRRLAEWCAATGVPFRRFETFDDVRAAFPAA
jgi:2-hydroxy-3-keto-5-methylthiopentenyl-1-phosphate phosphatase